MRRTRSCADESPQNLQEPIIVNLRTSFRGAALAVGGLLVMAGVVLANGGSADDRTGASTSPSANPTPGGAVFATLTPEPSASAEPSESPEATESPGGEPRRHLRAGREPRGESGARPPRTMPTRTTRVPATPARTTRVRAMPMTTRPTRPTTTTRAPATPMTTTTARVTAVAMTTAPALAAVTDRRVVPGDDGRRMARWGRG